MGFTAGAGAAVGVRLLEVLREVGVEMHLVMCHRARESIAAETGCDPEWVRELAHHVYDQGNQAAKISSGSFLTDGMIVAPCSGKSLAAIANGLATNLIHRAADVTIKEGRKLVLLVPELSLSPFQIENLARLSNVPAVVVRPLSKTLDEGRGESVDQTVASLVGHFGIQYRLR